MLKFQHIDGFPHALFVKRDSEDEYSMHLVCGAIIKLPLTDFDVANYVESGQWFVIHEN